MSTSSAMSDTEALDQIAGILGLYSTDPENNPATLVLDQVANYVRQTGRSTDTPEGA